MSRSLIQSPPTVLPETSESFYIQAPQWIEDAMGLAIPFRSSDEAGRVLVQVSQKDDCSLVSVRVIDAAQMLPDRFETAVVEAYGLIFDNLKSLPGQHPIRFWNFIPDIHQSSGKDRDRYMVFNAGRFAAFEQQFGDKDSFDRNVATASGVGHRSSDLVIHCLSATISGINIGNPRQIAPHHYSEKYGPLPPCFARATILSDHLLVGGTASICGEDSRHLDHLQLQWTETLRNLQTLVECAFKYKNQKPPTTPLDSFLELRIYYPRSSDRAWLNSNVSKNFSNLRTVELIRADLCRKELLVEIEGVAKL